MAKGIKNALLGVYVVIERLAFLENKRTHTNIKKAI